MNKKINWTVKDIDDSFEVGDTANISKSVWCSIKHQIAEDERQRIDNNSKKKKEWWENADIEKMKNRLAYVKTRTHDLSNEQKALENVIEFIERKLCGEQINK